MMFSVVNNNDTLQFDSREPDDPSPYLLAIWTPGRHGMILMNLNTSTHWDIVCMY